MTSSALAGRTVLAAVSVLALTYVWFLPWIQITVKLADRFISHRGLDRAVIWSRRLTTAALLATVGALAALAIPAEQGAVPKR